MTRYIGGIFAFPAITEETIEPIGAATVKGIRRSPALRADT
jgi:hypothetical protein